MSACDGECNLVEKGDASPQTSAAAWVQLISNITRSRVIMGCFPSLTLYIVNYADYNSNIRQFIGKGKEEKKK